LTPYFTIAELDITDPRWVAEYVQNVTPLVAQFGGRYLTRTSHVETLEGDRKPAQIVVLVEWPSREAGLAVGAIRIAFVERERRLAGARNALFLMPGEDVAIRPR
jgi:uncharacterized protein (DUF1330 family)